jgi:hypothetical protein
LHARDPCCCARDPCFAAAGGPAGVLFCRPKCHKNFNHKRNPRKMRWTKAFRKSTGKELTVDAAFEFEKRRDQPVRYDRDLVATTLRAMKKVEEIKSAQEKRHWAWRMEVQKRSQRAQVGRRRAWNRRASGRVVIVCAAHAQDKVDN